MRKVDSAIAAWIILTGVKAYDCFVDRYPLTIGCDDAESGLTSLAFDSSSNVYFGGWTQCSDLVSDAATKTAILGKHGSADILWMKAINHGEVTEVTKIENHFGDDTFLVLATSDSD